MNEGHKQRTGEKEQESYTPSTFFLRVLLCRQCHRDITANPNTVQPQWEQNSFPPSRVVLVPLFVGFGGGVVEGAVTEKRTAGSHLGSCWYTPTNPPILGTTGFEGSVVAAARRDESPLWIFGYGTTDDDDDIDMIWTDDDNSEDENSLNHDDDNNCTLLPVPSVHRYSHCPPGYTHSKCIILIILVIHVTYDTVFLLFFVISASLPASGYLCVERSSTQCYIRGAFVSTTRRERERKKETKYYRCTTYDYIICSCRGKNLPIIIVLLWVMSCVYYACVISCPVMSCYIVSRTRTSHTKINNYRYTKKAYRDATASAAPGAVNGAMHGRDERRTERLGTR